MTDPNENDSWADLYSDLGIDVPPSPPKPAPTEADPVEEIQLVEAPEDTEGESDDEFAGAPEDGEEGDTESEGDDGESGDGESGEGDPGQKKRRRRRRRRKKRGPGEAATGDAEPATESEPETAVAQEDEDEVEVVSEDDDSLEGASPEATREIISNWNVPSWQEIVAGLYRPDR